MNPRLMSHPPIQNQKKAIITALRDRKQEKFNTENPINHSTVKRFKPQLVAVRNESLISELNEALSDCEHKPKIIPGEEDVVEVTHRDSRLRWPQAHCSYY